MIPTIKLNNGVKIPQLGLGVWQARIQAIHWALEAGYRLIDTARIYGNEAEVGDAIRSSGLKREEVFVTTKLWRDDAAGGYEKTLRAFDESLKRLGFDYVDLYLIHWPNFEGRKEAWRALEHIHDQGLAKAIGVSNYTVKHLEEMNEYVKGMPAVNQVEFHPFLYQQELLEYSTRRKIVTEAYSPLARGEKLRDKAISEIANRIGKTNAQVMLRWSVQQGLVVIPKSVHRDRILENSQVFDFELSSADMKTLDALSDNYRVAWDPSDVD